MFWPRRRGLRMSAQVQKHKLQKDIAQHIKQALALPTRLLQLFDSVPEAFWIFLDVGAQSF